MSDGVVTRIRGDRDDVFSRGFICPKGSTLKHLHEDPDRLRAPQLRTPTGHRDATWDDAFAEIDRRLHADHRRARAATRSACTSGTPTRTTCPGCSGSRPFLRALGSRNIFTRVDGRPDAAPRVVGADVRRPLRVRRPRPRSNRLPADARRQPVRVERLAGHRAGLAGPPAGHPASAADGSSSSTRGARGPPRPPTSTCSSDRARTPCSSARSST